ncbi:histidinol-phosphate transaminase [Alphaproteobacteria bacterium LSUCC0744]
MTPLKYKKWIDCVERLPATGETRIHKLRLDKNERTIPFEANFIGDVLSSIESDHLCAYPEVLPFYNQLAEHLGLTAESLFLTSGSDAAIRHCFDLFVNPGDKVVVLEPTFAMVDVYCQLYAADRSSVGYDVDLEIDYDDMVSRLDDNTSLVIIANPNSPTGTYIPHDELSKILVKSDELGVPVLIDEAYHGFCKNSALSLLRDHQNLMISRTFSKAYGLAGLRIGFLAGNTALMQLVQKLKPMYEVNQMGILFASKLLEDWSIVDSYINDSEAGKRWLVDELRLLGFDVINTETNFIHVDFGSRLEKILSSFRANEILVRGGLSVVGYENFLRITTGPLESMERVIKVVNEAIS